jgi:hypothetical protein
MEWMLNAFWARIGWELAEVAMAIALIAVFMIFLVIPKIFQQRGCMHPRFRETSACDAICLDCGKNLGFIGTWRETHKNSAQYQNHLK